MKPDLSKAFDQVTQDEILPAMLTEKERAFLEDAFKLKIRSYLAGSETSSLDYREIENLARKLGIKIKTI